jgi:multiple sugar transport system ATP-binding protein
MASIRFASVSKHYGDVVAVRDFTLNCPQGEMLALLGPSGCGKSSTLKMVAGIEAVTEGEIFFDDRPVSRLPPAARNIAMVFEDYALYPHLTVRGNVAFPLQIQGAPSRERDKRVDEVLGILDLDAIAGSNVRGLSGGAQQRVAIGRALVRDPELILFDEPLSHLDGDQKVQLRGEIKRLQGIAGTTSILVTHDQTEATAMADRIAVMENGELRQVGTAEDLYERPANLFVAQFIGEPPMNVLRGGVEMHEGAFVLWGEGWRASPSASLSRTLTRFADREILVGIRPEHVDLRPLDGPTEPDEILTRIFYREPRGDTDIVTLTLEQAAGQATEIQITAEVPGPTDLRHGNRAAARFRADRLHAFDAATGRRLGLESH